MARSRSSKGKAVGRDSTPERAKELIAENKRTRAKFLYLGRCGLTRVPEEVGELVWLESLSLSDNYSEWDGQRWNYKLSERPHETNKRLSDLAPLAGLNPLQILNIAITQVSGLAPLAGLTNLELLYVHHTQVSDLAPLAGLANLQTLSVGGTYVSDLGPLVRLANLQTLKVGSTPVSDLAPLAGLTNLQEINLYKTPVSDLAPLAGLAKLQRLHVGGTQVSGLSPLAALANLQQLDVSRTPVSDLTPLAGLTNLQGLDVSITQVSDLSPVLEHIRSGLPVKWETGRDSAIYVKDCPLTVPPPEIVQQGNEAILNYFAERAAEGVDHLYEAKMLILGEGGAGKTSLLRRLYQPQEPLPREDETTKGIAIYRHEFKLGNGRTFRLNVWDFGGQQIYHAAHQFFLTHRSLYVLVDDTRKDYKSVSDEGFKYWLELIDVFSQHSPTLIFQNEKGGRSKQIDLAGIKGRYDNVQQVYAGDLERQDAVDAVRKAIEFYAENLPHIGEEVPARWIKVREEIEQLAEKQPYIALEKYFGIYGRHIEFDRTKALLLSRYLHDLGVFLHFQDDPLLARSVILQNEWATVAVFRILDDEGVKKRAGPLQPRGLRAPVERFQIRRHASGAARADAELRALLRAARQQAVDVAGPAVAAGAKAR